MSRSWKSSLLVGIAALIFVAVLTVQVQRVTHQVSEAQWQASGADQTLLLQNLLLERLERLKDSYPYASVVTDTEPPQPYSLLAQMQVDAEGDVVVQRLGRSAGWKLGREETASILSLLRQRDYQHGTTYYFLRRSETSANYHLLAFLRDQESSQDAFESQPRTLWVAVLTENPLEALAEEITKISANVFLTDSLGQELLGASDTPPAAAGQQIPGTNLQLHFQAGPQMASTRAAVTAFALRIAVGLLLAWGALIYFFRKHLAMRAQPTTESAEEEEGSNSETEAEVSDPVVQLESPADLVPSQEPHPSLTHLEVFADTLHQHTWSMLGPLQNLKNKGLLPEHQSVLLDMESHLRPLLSVSETLRVFFQKEIYPQTQLDISALLTEVCESYRARCLDLGVTLAEEIEEGCEVNASAYALRKALSEIFENSLQAMVGREEKILAVTLSRLDGQIRLRISDSGPGLSDAIRSQAFEPFATLQPGRKGLGLSYAYGVFKQVGAELLFDSGPALGAQLVVTLPCLETRPLLSETPAAPASAAVEAAPLIDEILADDLGDLAPLDMEVAAAKSPVDAPAEKGSEEDEDEDEDEDSWQMITDEAVGPKPASPIRIRAPRRNLEP